MALCGDRIALADMLKDKVAVFDLAGVQLYAFGEHGHGPAAGWSPVALCAHPNGNLLVREGCVRVREVTWTGDHVRCICARETHGWFPCAVDVSPDGTLIAVGADAPAENATVVQLLNERTCAPVKRFRIARSGPQAVRFSPDGCRVVVLGSNHRPTMFRVHGNGHGGTVFGKKRVVGTLQYAEFTDEGDVVIATDTRATVYRGTSLKPARSWAWEDSVREVQAIQAHRGLLYVLCAVGPHDDTEVHVYE